MVFVRKLTKTTGRDKGYRKAKALFWLLYAPLLVVAAAFAAANRHDVDVSLGPLPFDLTAPLFLVVLAAVLAGLVVGGASAWLSGRRWRRDARRLRRRAALLETEVAALRDESESGARSFATSPPAPPDPPERDLRSGMAPAPRDPRNHP